MANGNVELWIHVAAIIAAFSGAAFGAGISYYLEMRRRRKEEKERDENFKKETLYKLLEYTSELASNKLALDKIKEYKRHLNDLSLSLKFGDGSAFYYKMSEDEREKINSIFNKLLFSKNYKEAKDELESLLKNYKQLSLN